MGATTNLTTRAGVLLSILACEAVTALAASAEDSLTVQKAGRV